MKKKTETVEEVEKVVEKVEVSPKKKILPITINFGRDDLNQLRDRLNEVIDQH